MKKKVIDRVFHVSDGVSLRDYIDLRFEETHRAVDKAEKTMATRLEGMNEFRDQLKDQAAKFITRDELVATMKPVTDSLRELQKITDIASGKASQNALIITIVIAVSGFILGVFQLLRG